jgi:hypothetical protein
MNKKEIRNLQYKPKWGVRVVSRPPPGRPESRGPVAPVPYPTRIVVTARIHRHQDGSHPGESALVEAEIIKRLTKSVLLRRLDNGDYFKARNEDIGISMIQGV